MVFTNTKEGTVIMNKMNQAAALTLLASLIFVAGCRRSENPLGSNNGMQSVNMSVAFSKGGTTSLAKTDGLASTDSLQIDSAIVVFQRIKFESHIDSVVVDTSDHHDADDARDDANVTFKGPFVVHVRDTSSISFANQVLPAGTYDGIKFKIHSIGWGERFEDSDDFNHHPRTISDTSFVGWGIVVWGKVKHNGAWVLFTYRFGGNVEFKMKGNFVVPAATSTINVALRFDMASWFRDPRSGALLDPTDVSVQNRELINWAIRHSFQNGKGGHDNDRDGHPDND